MSEAEQASKKTIKRKLTNKNLVFHLQENQGTTIAKNYLLNENENLQKGYQSRKGLIKQQRKANFSLIESWHGQKLWHGDYQQSISIQNQKNKKVIPYIKKNILNINRKLYLKTQADFGTLKKNNTLTFDQNAVRLSQSMMEWDMTNSNTNIRNSFQKSLRSVRQHKTMSVSLKKYKLRKSNEELKINSQNKLQIYIKNKGKQAISSQIIGQNLQITQNIVSSKLKTINGLVGSTVKKKVSKNIKTKLLKIDKFNMNIEQNNKLQTNSPLKRELNKLISLLQQQKKCKEIYNNFDD